MPLYQLPNGKVIYLSIEDYLDLTDEDIQMLVASNHGEQPSNPFFGSVIKKPTSQSNDDYYDRDGLDYDQDDDDDINSGGPIDPNSVQPEDSDY